MLSTAIFLTMSEPASTANAMATGADVWTPLLYGLLIGFGLVVLHNTVHYLRLATDYRRGERECAINAWSALRRRLSHTRSPRTASGRRGQA